MNTCLLCGCLQPHHEVASTTPKSSLHTDGGCEACSKFEALEARLRETRSLPLNLLEEHRTLKSHMNHVHDPMSKLPPEIVSRIFTLCSPTGPPPPTNVDFDAPQVASGPVQSPLPIGAVSRRWREIAWSTPTLWARICVTIGRKIPRWQSKTAKQWLARSGRLPLSIYIRLPFGRISSPLNLRFHPVIQLLNQYSNRWAELDIDVTFSPLLDALQGDSHGLSILKTLRIGSRNPPMKFRTNAAFTIKNPIPSPDSVEVYGISFPLIGINWSHVTHVKLCGVFVDECHELFQLAPLIIDCQFDYIEIGHDDFGAPDLIVVHHRLQRLKLMFCTHTVVQPFFVKLRLPSLSVFEWEYIRLLDPLQSFLTLSSSPLTYLDISSVQATQEELINFLYATPLLSTLRLYSAPFGDQFLNLLAATTVTSIGGDSELKFVPDLQNLKVVFYERSPDDPLSWSAIPPIFNMEPPPSLSKCRPLKSFSIDRGLDYDDPALVEFIDEKTLSQMLYLIDHGIELIITDGVGNDFIAGSVAYHRKCKGVTIPIVRDQDKEEDRDERGVRF